MTIVCMQQETAHQKPFRIPLLMTAWAGPCEGKSSLVPRPEPGNEARAKILGIPCSVIPPNASVNGVQNFFPEEFIKRHISGQITTLKGTSFICHISSSSKHTQGHANWLAYQCPINPAIKGIVWTESTST